MGRSRETFGKKEVRNKKLKKRKEKEKRRLEKREQGRQSIDEMIAYVNADGVITSTPPDLTQKEEIDVESIEIGVPKKESLEEEGIHEGIVTKFDNSKGYGFIADSIAKESVFFHISDCADSFKTGDKVKFDAKKGFNGMRAKNVKINM